MKKVVLYGGIILSFILMSAFNFSFVQAKSAQNKNLFNKECWEHFNDKVTRDIKSSFPELKALDNPNDPVQEYTHSDLDKAMMATGGTAAPYIEPVYQLFSGAFTGEPKFYVAQPEGLIATEKYDSGFVGYFLYKKDEMNVMIKLRPGKTAWDIVDKNEAKGKIIPWKCEK